MSILTNTLSQYWSRIQGTLFPWLEEELDPLTEKQQQLVAILELVRIEEFLPCYYGREGRPPKTRPAIPRSFIAKMVYNFDTNTLLIERLKSDRNLRRICGWESVSGIPSESTFSRAFADFSLTNLPQRAHEELIRKTLSKVVALHNSRDSTAIEAREKPKTKIDKETKQINESLLPKQKKKGRPKKGEERHQSKSTRVEKQKMMTLDEMLKDLPIDCDKGAKKDSKGNTMYWTGYKLHLDTIDGGIPVSAIITSASVHDSQVAIPLATLTSGRIIYCYELMDAAYDVPDIIEHSQSLGHIPLIDKNLRANKQLKEDLTAEKLARKTSEDSLAGNPTI